MRRMITPAQKVASALKRAETTLRNWQDEPDSPRKDVDEMLRVVSQLRGLVAGHVMADLEGHHPTAGASSSATLHVGESLIAESLETYDHKPRKIEE